MQRQIGRTLQLGFCLCMTRSWFQLYLDFQPHFPAGGPWYHQGTKQWRFSQTRLKVSFLKQVRWFNSYITKVGQQLHSRIPINPQIPDSCFISFRTKTLPVSVTEGRHLAVENILGQWSSCFATPKELSDIFDCQPHVLAFGASKLSVCSAVASNPFGKVGKVFYGTKGVILPSHTGSLWEYNKP